MAALRLDDLRCPCCAAGAIADAVSEAAPQDAIRRGAYRCTGCAQTYDEVWGVPFVGIYERTEILGLIEIAANIDNRGRFGITPAAVEMWEKLLAAYHAAPDRAAFAASQGPDVAPFLANRYGEWVELHSLAADLHLDGADVLDLGAGLGFDAHRLALRGAKVTALEFSPLLAEAGREHFPHLRWIGGLSDVLPFRTGSFDFVFCNAALHHFRDIPAAIAESLRVLRPGGSLITTCDSFGPDGSDVVSEARIFDGHQAVLLGVNERVPAFSEFVETLRAHNAKLDVEIHTHTLYRAPLASGGAGTLTELTRWDMDKDVAMLSARAGSLALKVRLREPLGLEPRLAVEGVLSAGDYAAALTDQPTALARLARWVPEGFVNLPFPGAPSDAAKFELLNGWHVATSAATMRRAYRRGRWFLRRRASELSLVFDVRRPSGQDSRCRVAVLLNGREVAAAEVSSAEWRSCGMA